MARNTEPGEGDTPLPDNDDTIDELVVTGDAPPVPGTEPDTAAAEVPEATVQELQAIADARGLRVEGTGKDGRVLKDDLTRALEQTPAPPAGRPPLILVAQAAAANLTISED